MPLGILVLALGAPVAWFWLGSSGAVHEVRALEDRAVATIGRLRTPGLVLEQGPTRRAGGDIRLAWALSKVGSPDPLTILLDDPYWRPGRGVWVSMMFRSPLSLQETCLRLAERLVRPAGECSEQEDAWYMLPIARHAGVDGFVEVYRRRLRGPDGTLEREPSVVAEFSVKGCGTERSPGSGPCP